MENQVKNYGIDIEREIKEQQKEDWFAGAAEVPNGIAEVPEAVRDSFLPKGEIQRGIEDMMDCAARGPINIGETKFNFVFDELPPHLKDWLDEKGYMTKDGIEFSDAFNAIKSGTTKNGNSMKAPLQSVKNDGLVPKILLLFDKKMTWDQYHNPLRITTEITNLGKEFKQRFPMNYAKVLRENFDQFLNRDMLDVAGHAWPVPIGGVYPRTEAGFNHAFVAYKKPATFAFDNYLDSSDGDFIKKLAPDYRFFDYGYRLILRINPNIEKKACKYWFFGWFRN